MPARRFPRWSLLLGLACAAAGQAQTAAQWRAAQFAAADRAERIMHEADRRHGLLAQYLAMMDALQASDPKDRAFDLVFSQYLAWYQSYVGDYPHAQASFSVQESLQPGDRPSPLDAGYAAVPALEAIPALARNYRAVFLNEAHHIPLTRSLTVQLLAKLRAEGFDYFAAETLYPDDAQLQARGYPTAASGFYTREPVCAEMVRTALKLGFKVVAYEAGDGGSDDARERAQARNLYERVFGRDPAARLVVDAGYAHIVEEGPYLGGASMAEHFRAISGIDPLTVEQTMLIPHPDAAQDHPYYTAAVQRLHPQAPVAFLRDGRPWALRAGYDVSVLFPPPRLRRGRPDWLALGGLRRPYFVSGEVPCRGDYPCLVEARYAGEGDDAIPADRLLFDPPPPRPPPRDRPRPAGGATAGELYLRPGRYELVFSDRDGRRLARWRIDVPGGGAAR